MIRPRWCLFAFILIIIHAVEIVLTAPIGTPLDRLTDRYVTFDVDFEGQSGDVPQELELQLLEKIQTQNGLDIVRMQLLQLNLMKLLVVLDIFILLCVYLYAKDSRQHNNQIVTNARGLIVTTPQENLDKKQLLQI